MEHLRRGTLLFLIVVVLAAALLGYYFLNIYEADPSIRGTLVEACMEEPETDADVVAYMDLAGVTG